MTKEKITLSSITVDAQILPNNTLDAYISTEGSSGAHYKGMTAAAVGANVQELIECLAETNLEGTGRRLANPFQGKSLNGSTLRKMFTHYIERMRELQVLPADSADSIRCAGECAEATKWLKLCGINMNAARITDLLNGHRKVFQQSIDLLKSTDNDFVIISADTFTLDNVEGYLVGWITDNEEDEDNLTSYLLFVPVLSMWSDEARKDVLFVEGLEDRPDKFYYDMAAMDGPKVVLYSSVDTESGQWNTTAACATLVDKMSDYLNDASHEISEDNLQENSMEALREITEG